MQTPRLDELPPTNAPWAEIDVTAQRLTLWQGRAPVAQFSISTGAAGTGQQEGSGQTPLGWHYVRAAIGHSAPLTAAFRGRRDTGERYTADSARRHPERDWILGRILWLCGLEPGHNRSGQVDTQRRYIYLHGTPPDEPMGKPASHGCIRVALADLAEVFAAMPPGTPVWLHEGAGEAAERVERAF